MSNRRDAGFATVRRHGDGGRQPGCLPARRGAQHALPASSSRGLVTSRGAQERAPWDSRGGRGRWGLPGTAGCAPSVLELPRESGRRAAREVTPRQSRA